MAACGESELYTPKRLHKNPGWNRSLLDFISIYRMIVFLGKRWTLMMENRFMYLFGAINKYCTDKLKQFNLMQ